MSSYSLTNLATAAARHIGVLASGESLSAQQLSDALDLANKILDNWSSEQIQAPVASSSTQNLTANVATYAVGSAQTWNINPAPRRITSANLHMSNGVEMEVKIVSSQEWDAIPDRASTSDWIRYLFYTPITIDGRGIAQVSAKPQTSNGQLNLQYWLPFLQFPDTTTPTVIPAGYADAFEYALGRSMAPDYDVPWSETNDKILQEAMIRLRTLNAQLWGVGQSQGGQ